MSSSFQWARDALTKDAFPSYGFQLLGMYPRNGRQRVLHSVKSNNERKTTSMETDEESKAVIKQHLAVLKEIGIEKIDIAFSGYGDEGPISEVIFSPSLPKNSGFDLSQFDDDLYDYLDPARVGDWVNNEGGFGEIQIDVATGKLTGNINFNETTYTTEPLEDQL
jgi:hypothetical protein